MIEKDFEDLLGIVAGKLQALVRENTNYHKAEAFERLVFEVLRDTAKDVKIQISPEEQFHAFPDIAASGRKRRSWGQRGNG